MSVRYVVSILLVGTIACGSDVEDASPVPSPTGGGGASTSTVGGAGAAATSASTGVGGASTGGGGAATSGWRLYTLTGATGVELAGGQWSSEPLADAWSGSDAPTDGITATASFYYFGDLVVLTDEGQVHRRDGATWLAPVPLTTLFPGFLPDSTISSYTIPGSWPSLGTAQEDRSLEAILFSVSSPEASNFYLYDVTQSFGTPNLVASGVPGDGDADCSPGCAVCEGPERPSVREVWAFRRLDEDAIGGPDGYRAWAYYDDGNIYQYGASFCWERTPATAHPVFVGDAGAPDPAAVVAAYLDGAGVHMVVPP